MPEQLPGDVVGGAYEIVGRIGHGAYATVFEARHVRTQRPVALKILNAAAAARPETRQRFLREAKAASRIDSPHVIAVYDHGELAGDAAYLVMELLDGEDLATRLRRVRTLEEDDAARLALQALAGLDAAHAKGVLHRDIKPDNLFIRRSTNGREVLKIVDFGLSKLGGVDEEENLSITKTGVILGSPVYMSPEQCRGLQHMDGRSDTYSLGVVLFEAVTGRLPHTGETFNELLFKIALEDAPDVRSVKADVDVAFAAIVNRALARDRAERFPSARDFARALEEWQRTSRRGAPSNDEDR